MWVSAVFELASRAHIAQKLDSPYEARGVAEKRRFMNAPARGHVPSRFARARCLLRVARGPFKNHHESLSINVLSITFLPVEIVNVINRSAT